ncbi:hypothetical protein A6A08_02420 [Nocardiopsis sp. TSRI0078]|uniref:TfuA-like protein n=1 Tax=unclassified Nocardiopsis TaxID=2649073 RepID=UPI000939409D|nr:TfuA-like protein [Nocardiopsis sp. TSRI0078]OKI23643.1 hypothetical protein A6A08_02420 [Nocardiopsis sp. TSRI0078]
MRPVIFLGPSLDHESAARILDAEYLPPIARGDIDALLAREVPPSAIGIVDGRFLDSLSISPKEVLRAVDAGIPTFGSSSMGALRAAECAAFGMRGVGHVYEAYASGEIEADDEVAIVFDPTSLRALSRPMVDLRFAVRRGVEEGMIEAGAAELFLEAAKSLHFPRRTVGNALTVAKGDIGASAGEAIEKYFATDAPEVKREDALRLLQVVHQHTRSGKV